MKKYNFRIIYMDGEVLSGYYIGDRFHYIYQVLSKLKPKVFKHFGITEDGTKISLDDAKSTIADAERRGEVIRVGADGITLICSQTTAKALRAAEQQNQHAPRIAAAITGGQRGFA